MRYTLCVPEYRVPLVYESDRGWSLSVAEHERVTVIEVGETGEPQPWKRHSWELRKGWIVRKEYLNRPEELKVEARIEISDRTRDDWKSGAAMVSAFLVAFVSVIGALSGLFESCGSEPWAEKKKQLDHRIDELESGEQSMRSDLRELEGKLKECKPESSLQTPGSEE